MSKVKKQIYVLILLLVSVTYVNAQNSEKEIAQEHENVFLRTIVNNIRVGNKYAYEVTYRLYMDVEITALEWLELRQFNGFIVEEVDLPVQRNSFPDPYKGEDYYAVDIRKIILLPTQSGKSSIPGGSMNVTFEKESEIAGETFSIQTPFKKKN